MKEMLKELPKIDAQTDHNDTLEFANDLLDDLLRFYTLDQISAHSGISRRNLSYFRHRGITTFAMQLTLEVLAGRRECSRVIA